MWGPRVETRAWISVRIYFCHLLRVSAASTGQSWAGLIGPSRDWIMGPPLSTHYSCVLVGLQPLGLFLTLLLVLGTLRWYWVALSSLDVMLCGLIVDCYAMFHWCSSEACSFWGKAEKGWIWGRGEWGRLMGEGEKLQLGCNMGEEWFFFSNLKKKKGKAFQKSLSTYK